MQHIFTTCGAHYFCGEGDRNDLGDGDGSGGVDGDCDGPCHCLQQWRGILSQIVVCKSALVVVRRCSLGG